MAESNAEVQPLLRMSRAQLHDHASCYYKSGGGYEPEVALVEYEGARAIFKDYARTPGWFGRIVAPVLIWREASALRQLDGLDGVPRIHRQLDRRGLLIEYLPAKPWPQVRPASADSYDRLARLVEAMHERGIAHADLRAPSNVLVDAQGRPHIVDFVARIRRGRFWNLPWNWFYRQFVQADESALAKLRVRFAPELATDADRELLARRGPLERVARWVGERIREGLRRFVRWS